MLSYMIKSESNEDKKTIFICDPKYGEGKIISYTPAEGIGVFYSNTHMKGPYGYCGEYDLTNVLEINYCLSGKYEMEFSDHTVCFLTDGDFAIWSGKGDVVASDSSYKRYQGITICIDIIKSEAIIQQILRNTPIDLQTCVHKSMNGETSIVAKPGSKILHIFRELYDFPKKCVLDYLLLKISELLLLVYTNDFKCDTSKVVYYPLALVESAKGAKAYIEDHFFEHLTIAELARLGYVNSRKLTECFKYIYGMTINECLQKTRMTKASELLLSTDFKVSEIASAVGYDCAGRFTQMFKRHYALSPVQYRQETAWQKKS